MLIAGGLLWFKVYGGEVVGSQAHRGVAYVIAKEKAKLILGFYVTVSCYKRVCLQVRWYSCSVSVRITPEWASSGHDTLASSAVSLLGQSASIPAMEMIWIHMALVLIT